VVVGADIVLTFLGRAYQDLDKVPHPAAVVKVLITFARARTRGR
jgi:hypothetical protein